MPVMDKTAENCSCRSIKNSGTSEKLSLVSTLSGSSIFVCGFCHSFWIHDEDGWDLLSSQEDSSYNHKCG